MENPLELLLDISERVSAPVTATVHIKKGEEESVFNLLIERGMIKWIYEDLVFKNLRGT